jgi:magnesium-transporting ATPase (P-type)
VHDNKNIFTVHWDGGFVDFTSVLNSLHNITVFNMVDVTKKSISRFAFYSTIYVSMILILLGMYVFYYAISYGYFSFNGPYLNVGLIALIIIGVIFSIVSMVEEKRNRKINKLNEEVNSIVNEIMQNKHHSQK